MNHPTKAIHIDATTRTPVSAFDRALATSQAVTLSQVIARRDDELTSLAQDILNLPPESVRKRAEAILSRNGGQS